MYAESLKSQINRFYFSKSRIIFKSFFKIKMFIRCYTILFPYFLLTLFSENI